MLELRPNCEYCDIDLPPDSKEARICSYECTFCVSCVDHILSNVCPNCGGGFTPRPIRPSASRRAGVGLKHQPASVKRVKTKYSLEELKEWSSGIKNISPENR